VQAPSQPPPESAPRSVREESENREMWRVKARRRVSQERGERKERKKERERERERGEREREEREREAESEREESKGKGERGERGRRERKTDWVPCQQSIKFFASNRLHKR